MYKIKIYQGIRLINVQWFHWLWFAKVYCWFIVVILGYSEAHIYDRLEKNIWHYY